MSSPPDAAGATRALGDAGDALVSATRRFIGAGEAPGVVAGVVTAAGETRVTAAGFADAAGRRPLRPDSLLRLASITKLFTAIGIMQLRDEGVLRLDDPLVAHLPEFRAVVDPFGPIEDVTVRRLLMHESGLQCEHPIDDPLAPCWLPREELLARLGEVRVAIPPATGMKYSNLGFDLLGEVLARAGGADYETVVRRRILEPLGMASTALHPRGEARERVAVGQRAVAADEGRSQRFVVAGVQDDDCMPGSGGLWSSVPDLLRFLLFVLRAGSGPATAVADARTPTGVSADPATRVLAPGSLAEMMACRLATWETPPVFQGLAWYSEGLDHATRWVGHAGLLDGFSGQVLCSLRDGVAVAVLANSQGDAGGLARSLGGAAAAAVRAPCAPANAAARPASSPPAGVARLLGRYRDASLADCVSVRWHADDAGGGGLVLAEQDGTLHPLDPTGDASIWIVRGGRPAGERAWFAIGADGAVAAVNVAGFLFEREDDRRGGPGPA